MSNIDHYLHDLARYLPAHARDEILPEVRSHLLELAADGRRAGLADGEAQARAVAQFGEARAIGLQLRAAHGYVGWGEVVLAALPVLGITGLGWHFVGQHLPLWWYLLVFGWGALVAWRRGWPTWWYAWLGWLFLGLLAVDRTSALFLFIFPLAITLVAIERWEHATLMALPFTTYLAFARLLGPAPLLSTTGWGPGNVYPGNIVWLETAFSALWIGVLALSIKTARPHRRGIYLLAGLLGTQVLYGVALLAALGLSKLLPDLFVSALTVKYALIHKLPIALLAFGLTLYPPLVALVMRWLRQQQPGLPGRYAS
ncbi:MAG: hypothetical protein Kow0063_17770 [Anaerolineae bacterium]